ncbi:MAG: FAD-dependent oxidoreductase [Fimbriimonas sp.]|nr:FAD-dependent oxidoreductase [Fimbriimonas sp.]
MSLLPKLKAKVVDAGWLRRNVSCRAACPVHTNAQGYIEAIANGDFDLAYELARRPNPFVNICARICGHPCETACRRGQHDLPLSIRALKRAAADFSVGGMQRGGNLKPRKKQGKKVAVIGAGPAGVTAAHDLAVYGYDVTLFEASGQLGGMLYHGVPEYRLPREVLKAEIDGLLAVGVDVRMNTRIGDKIQFSDIRKEYRAVFIAVGAQKGRDLRIGNVNADGVVNGIDFLLNVSLGYKVPMGKRVVVIGGGNVAVDVARTAAREAGILVPDQDKHYEPAIDIARSAMRLGAGEVHMVCLESFEEMPAHDEEIEETLKEGIVLHPSRGPTNVVVKDGKCFGLETVKCLSVFDENRRFSPKFAENSAEVLECDTILLAIGQVPDLSFLDEANQLDKTPGGFVKADGKTMGTNLPGVYVGGDVAFGARTAIEGIADARRAALSIHRFLAGKDFESDSEKPRLIPVPMHRMPDQYDRVPRTEVPTIPIDRRTGVTEVEEGYTRKQAMEEASRCLTCNRYPMVDWSKCVLCGGCVDVCPFGCLKIVPVDRIEEEQKVCELAETRHGMSLTGMADQSSDTGKRWFVMVKDEQKCTRCALCVERCPVGAMWMSKYEEEGYVAI